MVPFLREATSSNSKTVEDWMRFSGLKCLVVLGQSVSAN